MLGVTGMLSFFFLGLRPWPRIGAAVLLLAAVEALRPLGLGKLMQGWYDTGLAGPWGTFSLSFFAITASALGELSVDLPAARRLILLAGAAAVLAAAGAAALFFTPFSKHLLSLSYILFTAGVSAGLLALLVTWRDLLRLPIPLLGSMGRNPLLLYMLHSVLGLGALALVAGGSPAAGAWLAALAVLVACTATAVLLDRRKLSLKL